MTSSKPAAAFPLTTDGAIERLDVGVSVADDALRERIHGALAAPGYEVEDCDADRASREAPLDCVITAAEKVDGAALAESRTLRMRASSGAAVLLCRSAGRAELRRALELGLRGLVFESGLERSLGPTVAAACVGQVSVPRAYRGCLGTPVLTRRERQILALVVDERTNAQIASEVFLAESTVKSHLSSAFAKLGVSSRNEAARLICDPELGKGLGIRRATPDNLLVADS